MRFVPVQQGTYKVIAREVFARWPGMHSRLTRFDMEYSVAVLRNNTVLTSLLVYDVPNAFLPYEKRLELLSQRLKDPTRYPCAMLHPTILRGVVDFAAPLILEDTFFTAR